MCIPSQRVFRSTSTIIYKMLSFMRRIVDAAGRLVGDGSESSPIEGTRFEGHGEMAIRKRFVVS